jgi:hypothetical protein
MGNTFKLGKLVNGFTVLDNGNVGVGISNPASILHLNGIDAKLTIQGTRGTGGTHSIYASGSNNENISIVSSSAMYFTANGSDRLVITSTGNIGMATTSPQRTLDVRGHLSVGSTTPTVGGSGYADIHLRTFSGAANSPARIQVVDNWFDLYSVYTDGFRFKNYSSDGVDRSLLEITGSGEVQFKNRYLTIATGTNNDIGIWIKSSGVYSSGYASIQSFSTGVTYDTNLVLQENGGRVGIGITAPVSLLHTYTTTSSDNAGHIQYQNGNTGTGSACNAQLIGKSRYGTAQMMIWESNGLRFGMRSVSNGGSGGIYFTVGNDTEAMRISSNGNVSVGTTLSTYRFQIAKVSQAAPALMISGAYYGGPRIQTYGLDADSNAWMGLGTDMGGNAYEHSLYYSTSGRQTIGSYDGSTYTTRFYILANGNYWFSGSNLSDVRLKENIQPISLTASEKIALLNPCSYNMKDDLSITKYGFIAQEVQDFLPDLIRGGSDKHEDFMGLDYDGIFTITVKAVQEILTRLTALENK